MFHNRRKFLQQLFSLLTGLIAGSSGLLTSLWAKAAWKVQDFKETSLQQSLADLFPGQKFIETNKITIKLPATAENGAIVPVKINCKLKNVQTVTLLVEKNPVPHIATFYLSDKLNCFITARIKMAESCDVIVVSKAGNTFYTARKKVTVTVGGCGG